MPAVWKVLADHLQLPRWRLDVQTVSLLTTEHDRPGTRRRITTKKGRPDVIEEIRIWYEGVGYEYQLVQGSDYREYVSRLRLQGTADGTIVQWTISYHLGSILKRFLQGRRRKKALETHTANSLRKLRQYIESTGVRLDQDYRDKNRIKQAPDANSRAEYGAKLVAQEQAREAAKTAGDTGKFQIPEPPVRLEDTPSVPKVMPPSFLAEAMQTSEIKVPEPEKASGDTRPGPTLADERQPPTASSIGKQSLSDTDAVPPVKLDTEPPLQPTDTRPRPAATATDKSPQRPAEPLNTASNYENNMPAAPAAKPAPTAEEPSDDNANVDLPPPTAMRDTGEISIWDVFGMKRPTEELSSIIDEMKSNKKDDVASQATQADATEPPTASESESDVVATSPKPTPLSKSAEEPEPAEPTPESTKDAETRADIPLPEPDSSEDETQPKVIRPEPDFPTGPTIMDNDPTQPKESIAELEALASLQTPTSAKHDTAEHPHQPASETAQDEQAAATSESNANSDEDASVTAASAQQDESQQPRKSLDEWLAEDEPPIPESSTDTMKRVVRIYQKPKIGLRRIQKQRQMNVRHPRQEQPKRGKSTAEDSDEK